MLDRAINMYEADLTALAWVQNYGGMTKLVNRENDLVKYPVSIHANFDECFTNQIYNKMMPDSKTTSIIYFEEILKAKTAEQVVHGSHKNDMIEGGVRCVVWVNLPKLGFDHTVDKLAFFQDIKRVFSKEKNDGTWKVNMLVDSIDTEKDTRAVFNQYKYQNIEPLFWYPYLTLTFNLRVVMQGCIDAMTPVTPAAEITCINYAHT